MGCVDGQLECQISLFIEKINNVSPIRRSMICCIRAMLIADKKVNGVICSLRLSLIWCVRLQDDRYDR